MKAVKIISILLFTVNMFTVNSIFSQSYFENDSLNIYLLDMINEYRSEKGLNELLLDTGMVKACQHHSRYLSFYDTLTLKDFAQHSEVHDTYSHLQEPINRVEKRAHKYANIASYITENVLVREYDLNFVEASSYLDQNPGYKDSYVKFKKSIELGEPDYKALAKSIIHSWKSSPSHNKALLDPNGYKCGVFAYFYKSQSGAYMSASTYLVTDDKWETEIEPIINKYSH